MNIQILFDVTPFQVILPDVSKYGIVLIFTVKFASSCMWNAGGTLHGVMTVSYPCSRDWGLTTVENIFQKTLMIQYRNTEI